MLLRIDRPQCESMGSMAFHNYNDAAAESSTTSAAAWPYTGSTTSGNTLLLSPEVH